MKYAFIERNRHHWPISVLCEVLDVSPSGFHQRRQRVAQNRPNRGRMSNDALLAHIKAIHAEVKGEYGWPRMWKELVARGVRVGKERVRKLMAQHGIRARHKRKFIATYPPENPRSSEWLRFRGRSSIVGERGRRGADSGEFVAAQGIACATTNYRRGASRASQ